MWIQRKGLVKVSLKALMEDFNVVVAAPLWDQAACGDGNSH